MNSPLLSTTTTPTTAPYASSPLSRLDIAICAYLALPLLLFCAWFKLPIAIGLALLVAFACWQSMAGVDWRRVGLQRSFVLAVVIVAIVATTLSGVGHFVYANSDWWTRDAVLYDLSDTAWPPRYMGDPDSVMILRAPVGYYLPSAVFGSLFGPHVADMALFAWTVTGLGLFLCATAALFSEARQRWICVAVMLGFGGLDFVGYWLDSGTLPGLGEHIQRWAGFAQYSANTTLLYWVPNHALPAWLGIALVLRLWRSERLARLTPLLAASITLWSPLSAVGLVPFFLMGIDWRRDLREMFSIRCAVPLWALAFLIARYLTMDIHAIRGGWAFRGAADLWAFVEHYYVFCMVEFGFLGLVLWGMKRIDLRLGVALIVLSTLPLYEFGPGNDLVMRSSIPSLTVLALAVVRPLAESSWTRWHYMLLAILAVGAIGAAQEPERALLHPRWALKEQTLGEVSAPHQTDYTDMLPSNYVGELNQPGLAMLLREPSMVRPSRAPAIRKP